MSTNKIVLLTNKKTGDIYEYQGMEKEVVSLKNHTSGVSGVVKTEDAKNNLAISVHLNQMAQDHPVLLDLIAALQMGVIVEKVNS